jgi:DNA-binding response OmpR family regulator
VGKGRILVIDDDEFICKSTRAFLTTVGYECDAADRVEIAEAFLSEHAYDLMISDIQMPGNSNLEFIKHLRDSNQKTPVILMTGYPQVDTAIESIQLGVAAYFVKPFRPEELIDQIQIAIQGSRVRRLLGAQSQRLRDWLANLAELEQLSESSAGKLSLPVDNFIELTFNNILTLVSDLKRLTDAALHQQASAEACHLLSCPRAEALYGVLAETIGVLEKTKNSFKSKELGSLRKKLETLLKARTLAS